MVLGISAEVVFGCAVFTKSTHGAAGLVSVFKTIQHHVIVNFVVAHAVTTPSFEHQVRRIGHAFHAACNQHLLAACAQYVVGEHGRTHARATHLGQSDGSRAFG